MDIKKHWLGWSKPFPCIKWQSSLILDYFPRLHVAEVLGCRVYSGRHPQKAYGQERFKSHRSVEKIYSSTIIGHVIWRSEFSEVAPATHAQSSHYSFISIYQLQEPEDHAERAIFPVLIRSKRGYRCFLHPSHRSILNVSQPMALPQAPAKKLWYPTHLLPPSTNTMRHPYNWVTLYPSEAALSWTPRASMEEEAYCSSPQTLCEEPSGQLTSKLLKVFPSKARLYKIEKKKPSWNFSACLFLCLQPSSHSICILFIEASISLNISCWGIWKVFNHSINYSFYTNIHKFDVLYK